MFAIRLLSLLSICFTGSFVSADNWGHWRGPTGNGVAPTGNPPTKWTETANVKWKVAIPGRGSGSPVIWDDRVFVVTAVPVPGSETPVAEQIDAFQRPGRQGGRRRGGAGRNKPTTQLQFTVLCFHRNDGKLLWKQIATKATPHESTHQTNGYASASPCTDGQHVYASFGSQGLYCYTMDGDLTWKRNDFGQLSSRNEFGEGSSPTIAGDKIIVPWDHEGASFLIALNKATGQTLWKTPRDEPSCWATPLIVQHGDGQQIIMNGQNYARGYDLESGKELWRCGGQTERPVASPVADHDLVFVGSGHRGSFLAAFRLGGSGDIEGTNNVAWSIERDTPDIASPLLSGKRLYFHKAKSGAISCLNAETGIKHFSEGRVPGISTTYASPIAAGGHVYMTGRSGTTVVIQDAENFEIVSSNSVGETVDATPAAVGDELFIRGEQHLFCISEK